MYAAAVFTAHMLVCNSARGYTTGSIFRSSRLKRAFVPRNNSRVITVFLSAYATAGLVEDHRGLGAVEPAKAASNESDPKFVVQFSVNKCGHF